MENREQEEAAAAEAGNIGGPAPETEGDEADRPVEEAGGGVSEGFEQAERELAEQARRPAATLRWTPSRPRPRATRSARSAELTSSTPDG